MRKTKIIATIGPASESVEVLKDMIKAGLNVARFNMSHGTHEEHLKKINNVKKAAKELNANVALMLDTKGPEIRLGKFKNNKVLLTKGSTFILTTKVIEGDDKKVTISYKGITKDVKKGVNILLNDGLVTLKVVAVRASEVECKVLNTGEMATNKGVNIPDVKLTFDSLTPQDKEDISFGVAQGVSYISASFIRNKQDVLDIRRYLKSLKADDIKIISKIENKEGVANFNEILDVSDGIMIARGDMGVELDMAELPVLQKMMIKKCMAHGKLVITATEMLESMIVNQRPTRAEISDVANSIYDGTSAIMLSGETAMGMYPALCVKTMASIATRAESDIVYWNRFKKINIATIGSIKEDSAEEMFDDKELFRHQINFAVCSSALITNARAIISISDHGKTPCVLSGYRPACPIYVVTSNEKTYSQMALEWGIECIYFRDKNFDELLKCAIDYLLKTKQLKVGDIVILGGGTTKTEETVGYLSSQTMGAVMRI